MRCLGIHTQPLQKNKHGFKKYKYKRAYTVYLCFSIEDFKNESP